MNKKTTQEAIEELDFDIFTDLIIKSGVQFKIAVSGENKYIEIGKNKWWFTGTKSERGKLLKIEVVK